VLVDSHCHLGYIEADPAQTMREANAAGVDVVVDIGMGTTESADVVRRVASLDGVYGAVGIHPNDLEEFEADAEATMDAIAALARNEGVVGVGETGLDFYRDRSSRDAQERAFRAHIAVAREIDRTLIIHCRDAHQRVLELLDETGPPERVIMHCFSGDVSYARECARRGFFCSFAGNVSFKKAADLRAAAVATPRDSILIETDAPFLAPEPFRGRPNAPRLLPHTLAALAEALDIDGDHLSALTRRNSARAFAVDLS
jgi:TatD DNase family protein